MQSFEEVSRRENEGPMLSPPEEEEDSKSEEMEASAKSSEQSSEPKALPAPKQRASDDAELIE